MRVCVILLHYTCYHNYIILSCKSLSKRATCLCWEEDTMVVYSRANMQKEGTLHQWWKPGVMIFFTRTPRGKACCSLHTSGCVRLVAEKGWPMPKMVDLLGTWLVDGLRVPEQGASGIEVHKALFSDSP